MDDQTLYLRMKAGDIQAFNAIYQQVERPLFTFIVGYVGREVGEEILQEAFMKLLHSKDLSFERGSLKAWLYSISRNLCLNHLQQFQNRRRIQKGLPDQDWFSTDLPLVQAQQQEALGRAVSSLPNSLATVYHLRCAGHSYQQIADQMNVPLGTVKSRMHQLTLQLRNALSLWREA